MDHVCHHIGVSIRRACKVLGIPRSTYHHPREMSVEEKLLRSRIIDLATQFGRYGYRRIAALLRNDGLEVNHKRVERIWREEGLKVPRKQPRKRRLWLNDGSCIRLKPEYPDHVWSYDFVMHHTNDGRKFRMLTVIDEYTRQCLAIDVARRMNHYSVMEQVAELFVRRGTPDYIRSDNGPEFIAEELRKWLNRIGIHTAFIEPGSPWENGYNESFNGKLRDEVLSVEIFDTLFEAKVLIERWRNEYNHIRPHSSLGYMPPAPEIKLPKDVMNLDYSWNNQSIRLT